MTWWHDDWSHVFDFFGDHRQGYSGPLGFILSGLVEDISSEGWQNMKSNRQVMVILRSEIWYFSSKIQNLEHPITLSVHWLEIARILEKTTKSAPKSRKINFLHNILSFPVFREVLDSIYVVHKCVGCFYTIATNFGFLVYTTFLYKSLVPVTLTAGQAGGAFRNDNCRSGALPTVQLFSLN